MTEAAATEGDEINAAELEWEHEVEECSMHTGSWTVTVTPQHEHGGSRILTFVVPQTATVDDVMDLVVTAIPDFDKPCSA